jgi:hypothetical protein
MNLFIDVADRMQAVGELMLRHYLQARLSKAGGSK